MEPEAEAEPSRRPRPKNPLQRLLRNFPLPWPSGIIAGLAQHPPAPYAEEAAEVQAASPAYRPQRPEIASLEPTKTEDQTIADESD